MKKHLKNILLSIRGLTPHKLTLRYLDYVIKATLIYAK